MTVKEKQKKQAHELHDKYYKGKKVPKHVITETKRFRKEILAEKKEPQALLPHSHLTKKLKEGSVAVLGNTGKTAGSRADLMDQARAKGVKNFRVLNKKELEFVLSEGLGQEHIDACVAGAVARWKSGWGKKSREAGKDHKE